MNLDEIVYTKEFVYFLGILWSDGYIERKRTILEIVEDDALDIVEDIKKINFLKICTMRRQRKNRRPQMSIYFCNTSFYDRFQSKYFTNKSESAPIDILRTIPDELSRYFYLGLIDGDGCFYFKNKTRQFYITSSFNQNWSHIIYLFDKIGVNQHEIRRIENKNGNKSSYVRVKKHKEIEALYNYLYPNGYEIGLKRKYLKCKEIVDNPPKNSINKSKLDENVIISYIELGLNIYQISERLDCNWRKIHNFCKKNNIKKRPGFYVKITNG